VIKALLLKQKSGRQNLFRKHKIIIKAPQRLAGKRPVKKIKHLKIGS
jgi:hypothetical protein